MSEKTIALLSKKVEQIKYDTLKMCCDAGTGHVNSSFSIAEILVALYHGGILNVNPLEPEAEGRDRFILSKGQASPILYTTLADMGFFPKDWLKTFNQKDGHFAVHLQKTVPGVELTTGSLGHGLGVAAGMALALKLKRKLPMVFCLLGDAECYEGSIWESATLAKHQNLNNLVALVDRNRLGATDFTEDMCQLLDLGAKFKAFGWQTQDIDGHNIEDISSKLLRTRGRTSGPTVFICHTVKGNGVNFLENAPLWHGMAPSGDDAKKAFACLKGIE